MGFGSIWHWLIVLAVIFGPLLAIKLAGTQELSRVQFVTRFATVLGVLLLLFLADKFVDGAPPLFALAVPVSYPLFAFWSAKRTNEIGWSKWWSALTILPLANIAYWLLIAIKQPNAFAEVAEEQ